MILTDAEQWSILEFFGLINIDIPLSIMTSLVVGGLLMIPTHPVRQPIMDPREVNKLNKEQLCPCVCIIYLLLL